MRLNLQRGFKPGTMISTIEVPKELRRRVSTGIEWLDEALGSNGGCVPTTTIMCTGGPGTGKSTLMRQLASSFRNVPNVLSFYNSGEESLYQAKMSCERLMLKNDFMVGEEQHLPTLLEHLDRIKSENPNKQLVLLQDSLQTLDDGKYKDGGKTGNTPVRCAEALVDWAQKNFAVVLFVGQANKGGDFAGKNAIKHAVDVHLHLWFDKKPKSETFGMHLFEIQKNRWGMAGRIERIELTGTGLKHVYSAELQEMLDDAAE